MGTHACMFWSAWRQLLAVHDVTASLQRSFCRCACSIDRDTLDPNDKRKKVVSSFPFAVVVEFTVLDHSYIHC